MNHLQQWMSFATAAEKKQLADYAGTTVGALRQASGSYKHLGRLNLTAEFAQRLARASRMLCRFGLPELEVAELCLACASCPYLRGRVHCNAHNLLEK